MPGDLLGAVNAQVDLITTDANTVVADAVALISYVASNYNTDTQLTQLVDNINADSNTLLQDILFLTTLTINPPKPQPVVHKK